MPASATRSANDSNTSAARWRRQQTGIARGPRRCIRQLNLDLCHGSVFLETPEWNAPCFI
jgi:hypothetical protein